MKVKIENVNLGKHAFTVYKVRKKGIGAFGNNIPLWEELTEETQAAWEAAAQDVAIMAKREALRTNKTEIPVKLFIRVFFTGILLAALGIFSLTLFIKLIQFCISWIGIL